MAVMRMEVKVDSQDYLRILFPRHRHRVDRDKKQVPDMEPSRTTFQLNRMQENRIQMALRLGRCFGIGLGGLWFNHFDIHIVVRLCPVPPSLESQDSGQCHTTY